MSIHKSLCCARREVILVVAVVVSFCGAADAQVPETLAAPGESTVVTVHAEGAQVY
jgi:hypothetical protein